MKFVASAKIVLLAVLVLAIQGCSITRYNYGGKSYSNSEDALAAQKQDVAKTLEGVTKVASPVGGKALVLIPSREVIAENGIVSRRFGLRKPSGSDKLHGFILDSAETGLMARVEAVKRGGVFESVVVGRNLADIQSEKPDYVVSLETTGQNQWQWYAYRADNVSNKIPVHADGTTKGAENHNSFNDSLRRAVVSLGGNAGN